ncbi:MAG: thiamine phosphate synthase [Planctomycetota bacterium]
MLYFRIIDVNLNRAREATRVIEDYARFVLEDADLSAKARSIRHQLVNILKPLRRQLLAGRDIERDVGKETPTSAKTTSEVITSNFCRLSEALRSISEYLKTITDGNLWKLATHITLCAGSVNSTETAIAKSAESQRLPAGQAGSPPPKARLVPKGGDYFGVVAKVERLRFEAYQLEQEFFFILRPRKPFDRVRLYVLVPNTNDKVIRDLIRGRVDAIQPRVEGLSDRNLLKQAIKLRKITRTHKVLLIINNRIDIALLSNADGVHLGEMDLSVRDARRILGPDKIIGATSHSIAEALDAQRAGADYISVGPMFPSPTKPYLKPTGFSYLKEVAKKIRIPYLAIGGITAANLPILLKAHKKLFKTPLKIAVSSGILNTNNIYKATKQITGILNHKEHKGY